MSNNLQDNLSNITSYNFYNKDWYIAADVVRHFKLSSNYNTYYSKYYSNGRLLGATKSYEFRLSGNYLQEFKSLYGANNSSLNNSNNAVWLIDRETAYKLLDRTNNDSTSKTVITIESNPVSIQLHLGKTNVISLDNTSSPYTKKSDKSLELNSTTNYNLNFSEEEISDAITLLSSKLTNSPYQQEKLLNGGCIRIDLFNITRRSLYAIELKKDVITVAMIKEKIENKQYLNVFINEYPDLNVTLIFSSPKGITFDALLYLQEISSSIDSHKVIYKPTSNLVLDMINKREKELPSYYYKQILDKPIIKYLLQVS